MLRRPQHLPTIFPPIPYPLSAAILLFVSNRAGVAYTTVCTFSPVCVRYAMVAITALAPVNLPLLLSRVPSTMPLFLHPAMSLRLCG